MTKLIKQIGEGRVRLDRTNYSSHVNSKEGKVENHSAVSNFRPIALLQNSFKIISKVLTNRLAPVMGELIGDYQLGFIKKKEVS